jgi:hypothetical protein
MLRSVWDSSSAVEGVTPAAKRKQTVCLIKRARIITRGLEEDLLVLVCVFKEPTDPVVKEVNLPQEARDSPNSRRM